MAVTPTYQDTKAYILAHPVEETPLVSNLWHEKALAFLHKHPTTVKVALVAIGLFALAATIAVPCLLPALIGLTVVVSLVTGITAALSLFTYIFVHIASPYIAPKTHDLRQHEFTPLTVDHGRLYYSGDVPVLELDMSNPFKAGQAHAMLVGDKAEELFKGVTKSCIMPPISYYTTHLRSFMDAMPEAYLEEMRGFVEGLFTKTGVRRTVEEIIYFHLQPDIGYLNVDNCGSSLPNAAPRPPFGCTTLVFRDSEGNLTMGRNLDWYACGSTLGTYTLLIVRKNSRLSTPSVSLGFPGLFGALTGINAHGVATSMNVCLNPHSDFVPPKAGIPALFFNRAVLEDCETIPQAESLLSSTDKTPLGPYHLTVASSTSASSFHFYQAADQSHVIRRLGATLVTTNAVHYSPTRTSHTEFNLSHFREGIISEVITEATDSVQDSLDYQLLAKHILRQRAVNSMMTIHSVVIDLERRHFSFAADNAYAAGKRHHECSLRELLR